jgi:hypothetical protein
VGVLEVGHEHAGPGVQRVDDHLAVDGAGDLHAAVLQVRRQRRHGPVGLANRQRLLEKIGLLARVEARLPGHARGHELGQARPQLAGQRRDELQRAGGQDLLVPGGHLGADLDPGRDDVSLSAARFHRKTP